MPVSKGPIAKNKIQNKRKKNQNDDLRTADEFEKKPKTKEITKKCLITDISTYTAVIKSKPFSTSCGVKSNSKVSSNKNNQLPTQVKSEVKKDDINNCVKPKKIKAPSKNVKKVTSESKSNKKEFLKNDDEEGEGINEGGKENKDTIIEMPIDISKTCCITTDKNKDVRKKFCEELLAMKSIKHVVGNKEFKNPKYKPNLPATAFAKNSSLNRYSDVKCIGKFLCV